MLVCNGHRKSRFSRSWRTREKERSSGHLFQIDHIYHHSGSLRDERREERPISRAFSCPTRPESMAIAFPFSSNPRPLMWECADTRRDFLFWFVCSVI